MNILNCLVILVPIVVLMVLMTKPWSGEIGPGRGSKPKQEAKRQEVVLYDSYAGERENPQVEAKVQSRPIVEASKPAVNQHEEPWLKALNEINSKNKH